MMVLRDEVRTAVDLEYDLYKCRHTKRTKGYNLKKFENKEYLSVETLKKWIDDNEGYMSNLGRQLLNELEDEK